MLERGRSRSPRGNQLAGDGLGRDAEGVGPVRGRDLFISVRASADVAAITFHAHSVLLLKYLRAGAFHDHLAFAEELDGASCDVVELVGDPPHVWRTLLELIYKHFDLLYDEKNRCSTGLEDLAESLFGKMKITADLFDLALLTHKHSCNVFQEILEKRFSRSFFCEGLGHGRWLKVWTPANAGMLLRCGMKSAVESWFMAGDSSGEPEDIPCSHINKFLMECRDDELRCIALDGAKHILDTMKDEETRKSQDRGDDGSDSSSDETYQMHGFKHYWDNYMRRHCAIINTVANIERMLEAIMETCKNCTGCAQAIRELSKVMPECLETSTWEVFVSGFSEGAGTHGIAQLE